MLVKEIQSGTSLKLEKMEQAAVCEELTDILAAYLPHTTVELFGSSASGKTS